MGMIQRYLPLGGVAAATVLLGTTMAAAQGVGGPLPDLDCLIEPHVVVKVGSPVDGMRSAPYSLVVS